MQHHATALTAEQALSAAQVLTQALERSKAQFVSAPGTAAASKAR